MLLTIPVPGAALTTISTRPKKNLKFVHIVGASYRLAKVNSAPWGPKVTFSESASVHSEGRDWIVVKSTEYVPVPRPLSFGQVPVIIRPTIMRVAL